MDKNPDLVEQEADRVTNKARKIGTTLRRKVANLGRVDGAFLVTEEPASKVKRIEGRLVRGVPFHTFKTWRDAVGVDAPGSLSPRQIETLARGLAPRSGVATDGAVQHLAGYVRLKLRTPLDERFHRVYGGVHASRQDRVLLHLYDLSASDEPNAETRARREFDALLRLRLHAWAPGIIESFQDLPGYVGELKFFTVADPAAPSLEERACDDSWDTTARLGFARDTVRALGELHDAGASDDNLDGSASWQGRSADTLLDEFLAPFRSGPPAADVVHLLAINDGRLLEWIEGAEYRHGRETPLTEALYDLLDNKASAPGSHIRFISLNQRSLVGSVAVGETTIQAGFLERLLDSLYGGENAQEIWAPCRTCSAQDRCEVLRAARLFGPDVLPDPEPNDRRRRAKQRLFEMLQAVHLRGETHITLPKTSINPSRSAPNRR